MSITTFKHLLEMGARIGW